jgi:hypothetical protein
MTCHKEEGETATPIMREDMLVVVSFASNDSHRSQETHLTGLGAKLTNAAIHPRVRYSSLPSSRMETQDYHHNNLRVSKINGLYQLSQESFGFNPYVSVNLARIPHDASLVQVSKTRMHGWWRSWAISWNSCVHSTSKPMPLFSFVPGDVETPMGTRWSCLYGRCSILPSDTIQPSTDFMCEKGKLAWYTMVNNFACN